MSVCSWTQDRDQDFLEARVSVARLDAWLAGAEMPCAGARCSEDRVPCGACKKLGAYYSAVSAKTSNTVLPVSLALRGCDAEELARAPRIIRHGLR